MNELTLLLAELVKALLDLNKENFDILCADIQTAVRNRVLVLEKNQEE